MAEPLTTTIDEGPAPRVRLIGDIDRNAAEAMDQMAAGIITLAPTKVTLDFGATGYIDSSGIALIVGLLGKARAHEVEIEALGLSDHYRHVFEITRLNTYMTILEEEIDHG